MACSVRAAPRNKESTFQGEIFLGEYLHLLPKSSLAELLLVPWIWSRWPDISFRLQRICKQLGQSQSEKYAARAKGRTCIEDSFFHLVILNISCKLIALKFFDPTFYVFYLINLIWFARLNPFMIKISVCERVLFYGVIVHYTIPVIVQKLCVLIINNRCGIFLCSKYSVD